MSSQSLFYLYMKVCVSIVAFVLLASLCSPVSAQFSIGAKGGVSINSLRDPNDFKMSTGSSVAFHGGLFSNFRLSDTWSITPELLYSVRGFKVEGGSVNLRYIEVPVVVSYAPIKALAIEVGPDFAWLAGGRNRSDGKSSKINMDLYKRFDFGVIAGLRCPITEKISVAARYYLGLTPMFTVETRDMNNNPTPSYKLYNKNIQVSVGYKIR